MNPNKKVMNYAARQRRKKRMQKEMLPPGPGWVLTVNTPLNLGQTRYPRGSVVEDVSLLGINAKRLLDIKSVVWTPPSTAARPQPYPLAPPVQQKPRPVVQLVEDVDPVTAWQLSVQANTRAHDGDSARAIDAILFLPEGKDLWRRASHEASLRKVTL
jgi:hypothetical protein